MDRQHSYQASAIETVLGQALCQGPREEHAPHLPPRALSSSKVRQVSTERSDGDGEHGRARVPRKVGGGCAPSRFN